MNLQILFPLNRDPVNLAGLDWPCYSVEWCRWTLRAGVGSEGFCLACGTGAVSWSDLALSGWDSGVLSSLLHHPRASFFFLTEKLRVCRGWAKHSVLPSTSPAQRTRTLVCAHTLISRVSMSWNNSHGLVIQIVLRRSRSALTTGISLLSLGHFPRNSQIQPWRSTAFCKREILSEGLEIVIVCCPHLPDAGIRND